MVSGKSRAVSFIWLRLFSTLPWFCLLTSCNVKHTIWWCSGPQLKVLCEWNFIVFSTSTQSLMWMKFYGVLDLNSKFYVNDKTFNCYNGYAFPDLITLNKPFADALDMKVLYEWESFHLQKL